MVNPVRVLPVGRWSWLLEVPTGPAAQALHRHLAARRSAGLLPGVLDLVPGARTVLLDAGPAGPDRAHLAALLDTWDGTAAAVPPGPPIEIPVRYDGPDLAEVCRRTGLDRDGLIAAHTGADFTVAFCGFAPGFAYLTGTPAALHVPRRPTPRAVVPAGAVGLAGEYSAVYPTGSPGGWQLIGRTAMALWDETRPEPARLTPGVRVRFTALPDATEPVPDRPETGPSPGRREPDPDRAETGPDRCDPDRRGPDPDRAETGPDRRYPDRRGPDADRPVGRS
ncbi:allophanate hydrolase subunit 1 [Plantactinospora siamensis]|uniref:Allophanate hydrolase subunit 1 n=1 Tax=Plantactinospora siamensis TaxID=555372 RepID=A0ABV6NXX3_9ACTN